MKSTENGIIPHVPGSPVGFQTQLNDALVAFGPVRCSVEKKTATLVWTATLDPPIAGPGKFGTSPDATIFTSDPEGSVVIRQKVWAVSGKLWLEEEPAEVTEVLLHSSLRN